MFWFKSNKKKEKLTKQKSTKQKVEENIYACKRSKNILLDKRDELNKKINNAINSTYFVPSAWWYKEFEHYTEIQELRENLLLSTEIKQKCDELVLAYRNEVKLLSVQIEHCDSLLLSYFKALDKIYNSKDEFRAIISDLQKMRQLDKYSNELSDIKQNDTKLLENELLQEEKYKSIKHEIDNLQKDLDLFEEYIKQLKELS